MPLRAPIARFLNDQSILGVGVELLEHRQLLTGNVDVSFNAAGDVIINGDAQGNQIEIGTVNFFGEIVGYVSGQGGTTVSAGGEPGPAQLFPLVTLEAGEYPLSAQMAIERDLRITMRGGDDVVNIVPRDDSGTLVGVSTGRHLNVNMGSGSDYFQYSGGATYAASVGSFDYVTPSSGALGRVTINGGGGAASDTLFINRISVVGRVRMTSGSAGAGMDQLIFHDSDSYAGEDIDLIGGAGRTEISFSGSHLRGDATLESGSGADQVFFASTYVGQDARIRVGTSPNGTSDVVRMGSSRVVEDLDIDGGAGRTQIDFQQFSLSESLIVLGETTIHTGGGDDLVRVLNDEESSFHEHFRVVTGGGDDQVDIHGKTYFGDGLTVTMSGGSDTTEFHFDPISDVEPIIGHPWHTRVIGPALINGGGGFDSLLDADNATWFDGPPAEVSVEQST